MKNTIKKRCGDCAWFDPALNGLPLNRFDCMRRGNTKFGPCKKYTWEGKIMKWTSVGKIGKEDVSFSEGWLWIGQKEEEIQTLAVDSLDYRYTHGGPVYRQACEMVWEFQERRE